MCHGHRRCASGSTTNGTNSSYVFLCLPLWIVGILLSSLPWISCGTFRKCEPLRLCLRKSQFLWICDVADHNRKSNLLYNSTHDDSHIQWSFGRSLCVGYLDSFTSWIIVYDEEGISADVGTILNFLICLNPESLIETYME